ncbi:MAG: dihydrodipicolinate synthase family protein [Bacillota bacterium]|nr:dihydrodipicolinate synthase family protein [Bacillota bacterium]
MMTHEEVKAALSGPVASVSTPFMQDGSIDWRSLRRMVDFIVENGGRTVLLTCGDSLYTVLTDDEIAEVTRAVVEQTRKRAMTVAAGNWWLGKSVAFARFLRDIGVDLYMPLPPDWAGSCTNDGLITYFETIANEMPVMLVTSLGGRPLPMPVISHLHANHTQVMAVKDDICGAYGKRLVNLVQDKWSYLSGGRKINHLDTMPYGATGYLSVYMRFLPVIAHRYWQAISKRDLEGAVDVIRTYDIPFMEDLVAATGLHFDALIHAALEVFGLAERWRRNPYVSASDQQMEQIRDFFTRDIFEMHS